MSEDYYKILEVHPEASIEVIEKAYRVLALQYHPDKHPPARKRWAEEKFKRLSEAHTVLKDPFLRRSYDQEYFARKKAETASFSRMARPGQSSPNEEQAYFHFKTGLECLASSKRASSLDILVGKAASAVEKAKVSFETVLRHYPNSKYAEEAFYRWLRLMNETLDSSEAYLRKIEAAFDEFAQKYPASKWNAEVKLERARFYLLKRKDLRETKHILHFLESHYDNPELTLDIRAIQDYISRAESKASSRREKVRV